MTSYYDFDPWGMAGNAWAADDSWNSTKNDTFGRQDYGGGLNIGANTLENNNWSYMDSPAGVPENTLGNYSKAPGFTLGGRESLGEDLLSYPGYDNNSFLSPTALMGSANPMLKESVQSGYWGNNPLTLGNQQNPSLGSGTFEQAAKEWNPFDIGDTEPKKTWLSNVSDWMKRNPDLLRLGMGLLGAYKGNQASNQYNKLAQQMIGRTNPYASQYAAGHYNYYQNPGEWTNSPQVQTLYKQAANDYARKMAAQGRTNPNEMALGQANILRDIADKSYVDWMKASYPWGQVDPSVNIAAANMGAKANSAKLNQWNGLLEGLLRMSGIPQKELGTTKTQPTKSLETNFANMSIGDLHSLYMGTE